MDSIEKKMEELANEIAEGRIAHYDEIKAQN